MLERNGFAKSPDQSGHFWRFVPFVMQWEIEEDRPWQENTQLGGYIYSIYAGRRLAPRTPNRQDAVPDNGPAEGLCMFFDM